MAALVASMLVVTTSIHTPIARSQEDDPPPAEPDPDPGTDDDADAGPLAAVPQDATARKRWLKEGIEKGISERKLLADARVGIVIKDLASEEVLFERDPDGHYNIASNNKIITTAAALTLLGPGFRARTSVVVDRDALREPGIVRGNLYIRGSADPGLGVGALENLAKDIDHLGIHRITGGLVIDDTYFDHKYLPPKYDEQKKSLAHYRAPIGAVSFNRNRVYVIIRPDPSGVGPAIVVTDPPNRYVRVVSEIQTVETGRTRINVSGKTRRTTYELKFTGQIRWNSPVRSYKYRVPDPVQYFGSSFQHILRQRGIKLGRKRIRRDKAPRRHRVLAYHDSAPLAALLRGLGKFSNNYMAEMILKTMGAEGRDDGEPATWKDGLKRVRAWLGDAVGLAPGSYRYDNGSGLFDASELSPRQMISVLETAYRDFRIFPDLSSSLSIAGVDGTLRRRMRKSPARGLVRAKTGTLARVITLSGYAGSDTGRPIAFSVFVNDLPKRKRWSARREARGLADTISDMLTLYARR
jgi:D-alanyl-D-alanine carboxypeptidase/D-alanyl-D-alanine-endopeptidase (penicillin-binding protein 4)